MERSYSIGVWQWRDHPHVGVAMYSVITYSVWRLLGRVGVVMGRVGGAYTVSGLLPGT